MQYYVTTSVSEIEQEGRLIHIFALGDHMNLKHPAGEISDEKLAVRILLVRRDEADKTKYLIQSIYIRVNKPKPNYNAAA